MYPISINMYIFIHPSTCTKSLVPVSNERRHTPYESDFVSNKTRREREKPSEIKIINCVLIYIYTCTHIADHPSTHTQKKAQ